MSSAMRQIFGGSKETSQSQSQSSSSNQAYPYLQSALSGTVSNGTGASNQLANMLGLNGGDAQNQGFDNFRNSTGYQFGMDQGMQAITGSQAAKGLVNSGSTLKALNAFGHSQADQAYGGYMNQLQGLLGSGLKGADVISGAGNIANSTSSSVGKGTSAKGMTDFIGQMLTK